MKIETSKKFASGTVIVFFDVGEHGKIGGVGMARALIDFEGDNVYNVDITSACLAFPEDAAIIAAAITAAPNTLVGIEHFQIFPGNGKKFEGNPLLVSQCEGYIRGLMWAAGQQHRLFEQTPSQKEFVPTDKAIWEQIGYKPKTEHEKDAVKHIIYRIMG